jgi:hypothetical protein
MHGLTPLGTTMHLKELDRQATPKLRPLQSRSGEASGATSLGVAVIALMQRLHAVTVALRLVRQS